MKQHMDRARLSPWNGIKSKSRSIVKIAVTILVLVTFGVDARATSSSRSFSLHDTDTFPPAVRDRELPNIEARSYEVQPIRMSNSKHSYLFKDPTGAKPVVGRIILLKKNDEPVMAFRVLRTYPQTNQFIARRVRRYNDHQELNEGDTLIALERTNEIPIPNSMSYSASETRDITELAEPFDDSYPVASADFFRSDQAPPTPDSNGLDMLDGPNMLDESEERSPAVEPLFETAQYDPELDVGTSPLPNSLSEDDEDVDISDGGSIEEVEPLDRNNHGLAAQFGFLRTNSIDGGAVFYKAGGLRYGLRLGKQLLLSQSKLQDDLTAEGGLFFYSVSDYAEVGAGDAFSVMSFVGTLRYTIHTSDTFGLFFYGGMMRNSATSTGEELDSNEDALISLSGYVPSIGGGMIFRMGPGWELRADLGADMIAMGLMLRF